MLDNQYPVHAFAGALTIKLRSQLLRYCNECAAEDRDKWGETYWHRIHNVTGVEVCPFHDTFLIDSRVPIRRDSNMETFVTAESTIPSSSGPPPRIYHRTYSVLARELLWLLNQGSLSCDRISKSNRYARLLHKTGFATFAGVLRGRKLEAALRDFYGSDLLRTLQSEVDTHAAWVRSVIQKGARGGQAPYRHILILNFLGVSVQQLFALPTTPFAPFGQAPWPCLNRTAEHFKQLVITKCSIRMATDGSSRPLGYFQCDCGFVYARLGPDNHPEDRFRYHRVRKYGSVWYDKMTSVLAETGSRSATGAVLGVCTNRITNLLKGLPETKQPRWTRSSALIEERRKKWEDTVRENPNLSRNQLRQRAGNIVYDTLRRCDRAWLELHSPPKMRGNGTKGCVNWPERDRIFASKVSGIVTDILKTPGKPIRFSATRIARRLGAVEMLLSNRDLLPLTQVAITKEAESILDFAVRRIHWAADSYTAEGIEFNFAQLKARSGLSYAVGENPKIVKVIRALVDQNLQEEVNL